MYQLSVYVFDSGIFDDDEDDFDPSDELDTDEETDEEEDDSAPSVCELFGDCEED